MQLLFEVSQTFLQMGKPELSTELGKLTKYGWPELCTLHRSPADHTDLQHFRGTRMSR